jgi:hypothetical protein
MSRKDNIQEAAASTGANDSVYLCIEHMQGIGESNVPEQSRQMGSAGSRADTDVVRCQG